MTRKAKLEHRVAEAVNRFRTNLLFRRADYQALVTEFSKKPPRSLLAEMQKQYELIAKDEFYLHLKRFSFDVDAPAPYQPLAPVGTRDGSENVTPDHSMDC
jgi:hypothetical protein